MREELGDVQLWSVNRASGVRCHLALRRASPKSKVSNSFLESILGTSSGDVESEIATAFIQSRTKVLRSKGYCERGILSSMSTWKFFAGLRLAGNNYK